MSASYWVLFADELAAREDLRLPPGLRFTLPASLRVPDPAARLEARNLLTSPAGLPGAHWQQVEDDAADPALEGCRVELIVTIAGGTPVLAERRVIT